jgi:hypothetical protein
LEAKKVRRLITAAAFALLATTAHAENATQLYAGGYWNTAHYARNSDGKPMCVISGQWDFKSGATGSAIMKWSNENGLFLHIAKSTWSFPAGVEVPMSISFDKGTREGTGTTTTNSRGGSMIEITIPNEHAVGFLDDFADADQLTITFKQGNEPPWMGKMDGSRMAAKWFRWCIGKIANNSGVATSPVPQATPTSPIAPNAPIKSVPTQPIPGSAPVKTPNLNGSV